MLRIKDPKVSVPFYEKNFGMKLVHKIDFPEWSFTVFFLERQRIGQESPPCTLDASSVESEKYLNTMDGCTIELTWNHGTEDGSIPFSAWNGNTGADAGEDSPNYAVEPKARGFGHLAFNVDDVYAACAQLEANGVTFQKKPDEGRMKGLAFALDPDGYWLEIVQRQAGVFAPEEWNLSQTMLRVKDGPASLKFYTEQMGLSLVRVMHFEQWKFSLYFLASVTPEELAEAFAKHKELFPDLQQGEVLDPEQENQMTKILWQPCLELTYNHGTELDPDFKVHDGNAEPQGFGHIGFLLDNLEESCAKMEDAGVAFKKKPSDGKMRGIAFAYDPDGYWVELIDRTATFAGVCSSY